MTGSAGREQARLDFLACYLEDHAAGRVRPVEDYLARFPEAESEIRREVPVLTAAEPAAGPSHPAAPPPFPAAADEVGPYRLLRELGRGGQGVVWLAEDTRIRRQVALKILHGLGSEGGERLRRFLREAEVASRLDHPAICSVLEASAGSGRAWIAMRFIEGRTLAAAIRLARRTREEDPRSLRRLDIGHAPADPGFDRFLSLVETTARALHLAHEHGIIHRDVKPGNIMVTQDGAPVILDFGLARDSTEDLPTLTSSGEVMGTPAYMAPEQLARGAGPCDRRTDVWGLGVLLFEGLTLERPFEAPTAEGICQQILGAEPPDPQRLNPEIPKDLAAVVLTAIEKDRARRYHSAADLADDLRRVREHRPVSVKPLAAPARAVRWARRRPAQAGLLLAMLALMCVAGYLVARWPDLQAQELRERREEALRLVELGCFALEEAPRRGALPPFVEALAADPSCAEALAGIALTHLTDREPAKAVEALRRRSSLVEEHPALRRLLADALAAEGRSDEAGRIEAGVGEPSTAFDFFALGLRELLRGEEGEPGAFPKALQHFDLAVVHARTANPLFACKRAAAAGRCRNGRAAREASDVLLHLWPEAAVARFYAGSALVDVDAAEAVVRLGSAIALRPDDARFHFHLGNALREAGRRQDAESAYRRALALRPGYIGPLTNLGNLLQDDGRTDEAHACLARAVGLAPGHADAWYNLGCCLQALGRADDALAAYGKALEIRPRHGLAAANLASLHISEGRPAEALPPLERALVLEPEDHDLHLNLGVALRALGRLDEAADSTRRALARKPRSLGALQNLGIILLDAGKTDEAVAAWRAVLDVAPDSAMAWTGLARALRSEGDLDGAREALMRVKALGGR